MINFFLNSGKLKCGLHHLISDTRQFFGALCFLLVFARFSRLLLGSSDLFLDFSFLFFNQLAASRSPFLREFWSIRLLAKEHYHPKNRAFRFLKSFWNFIFLMWKIWKKLNLVKMMSFGLLVWVCAWHFCECLQLLFPVPLLLPFPLVFVLFEFFTFCFFFFFGEVAFRQEFFQIHFSGLNFFVM